MTLDELQLYLPGRTAMSVHGIYKLGRMSTMLQIWHLALVHFLLLLKVGVLDILVLMSICLKFGGFLYAHSCDVEQVFGGRMLPSISILA